MAPKSRSGVIRMAIAPVHTRLVGHLRKVSDLENQQLPEPEQCYTELDSIEELEKKINNCIQTLTEKDKQWQDLILSLDTDELSSEEDIYSKTALNQDTGYLTTVETAKESVCHLERRKSEINRIIQPVSSPTDVFTSRDRGTGLSVKLPKLILPTFSGDYLEWTHFWAIFKANIHDRNLDPVEKFSYLCGQLSGSARKTIDGLQLSAKNYETAVQILRDRYERSPTQLVGVLYGQLKRIRQSAPRIKDMLATYDSCERVFRQLEDAGEALDANRSLVLELLSKYPTSVLKDLNDQRAVGPDSTLREVRDGLREYIRRSEAFAEVVDDLDSFTLKTAATAKNATISDSHAQAKIQTSAFTAAIETKTNIRNVVSKPQNPCYFCHGLHFNSRCTKYKTAAERVHQLSSLKRCTKCLSSTHVENTCPVATEKLRCFFCKSNGTHVSSLCPSEFPSSDDTRSLSQKPSNTPSVSTLLNTNERSFLLTAYTKIVDFESGKSHCARVLFDSGSHRSYVTEACSRVLQLSRDKQEALHVAIFGTDRTLSVSSEQVKFGICQKDGSLKTIVAHTTPVITSCPIQPAALSVADVSFIEQNNFQLADVSTPESQIDILIGSDYFWEFLCGNTTILPSGLRIIPSTLGILIGGRRNQVSDFSDSSQTTLLCLTETFSAMPNEIGMIATKSALPNNYPDISEYWALEKIGITDSFAANDDDEALQQFNESVVFSNGRYEVKWPWKYNSSLLPVNYELALGRFKSLAKRLRATDNSIFDAYQIVIDDQLRKGVIERVPDNELETRNRLAHYLPHHPVIKPSSATTKVRIVYDASARTHKDNPSLNDCLYRGPVLLPDLCSVLIRFRLHSVAIVADVEKAFLQLGLQLPDRDVTRFLWFDRDSTNPSPSAKDDKVATYRFCRVPFGIISSPFLLCATLRYHLKKHGGWVSDKILNNIYVDNVITGVSSDELGRELYASSKRLFAQASMNLQEFCSNSTSLCEFFEDGDKVKSRDNKVLGMCWDSMDDTIRLKYRGDFTATTKRNVLEAIASVYDPLGLFQPVLLKAKLFLQSLWESKIPWDECLSEGLRAEWENIEQDIRGLFDIRIPRCPAPVLKNCSVSLCTFCDASLNSYAATVYMRILTEDGHCSSNLIFSKSRLRPKSRSAVEISLPRMELLGMLIGTRASIFVRNSLLEIVPNVQVNIFTDSTCVLHWIRAAKPLSVFVENRIKEINKAEFKCGYVCSAENPADLSTRGVSARDLKKISLWWHGPSWLTEPCDQWPSNGIDISPRTTAASDVTAEYRKRPVFHTLLTSDAVVETSPPLTIDPTKYSSYNRLIRVTAVCLNFLKRAVWERAPQMQQKAEAGVRLFFQQLGTHGHSTVSDLDVAKKMWLIYVQDKNYSNEKNAIAENRTNSLVKQLGLFIDDDGIIRCKGRLMHADVAFEASQPKLLAKNDYVSNLIIEGVHRCAYHVGVGHTLSQLRQEYWIPCGRAAVRKIINACVACRRFKGSSFALPPMPPLPRERLSRSRPFEYTGLDYLGPISVRIGTSVQKMWICLFACLAVRAVHLEWISDCSGKQFLDCLIRFVSRRGAPSKLISDNAPQFKVTKNVLDKLWLDVFQDSSVQSYAAERKIEWNFTTELAPWQGGFYERLVALVKGALRFGIGRSLRSWEELLTLIAETEAIVNSRPITYVYSDFDSGFSLRPIDFVTELSVGISVTDPHAKAADLGEVGKNLVKIWKSKQRRLDILWEFWHKEYLLSLRERYQSSHKGRKGEIFAIPKLGEVVLVKDTELPRGCWKVARVSSVFQSEDGRVRSAELKLPNGLNIKRSINHLYPLEIKSCPQDDNVSSENIDFDGFEEEEVQEAEKRILPSRTLENGRKIIGNGLAATV